MRRVGLDAYLVPATDPHQSEYVPVRWQRRQFLSGFTGSTGDLIVGLEAAALWTDSRYYLQAEEQLAGSDIALQRMGQRGVPTAAEWLRRELRRGAVVGGDSRVLSLRAQRELGAAIEKAGATLRLEPRNLVDRVWRGRPRLPDGPLAIHPQRFAGEPVESKLRRLRVAMGERDAQAHVVTRLDSVAWLFNVRGADVDFTPVALAHALVTMDEAILFVDPAKVPRQVARRLARHAELRPYDGLASELRKVARRRLAVWVDPLEASAMAAGALRGARLVEAPSPVVAMKARKNRTETAGARRAHERDGVALVRFFAWLEGAVRQGGLTELGAARRLEELRREAELYEGPSFSTISAVGAHGAIVHYGPTEESDRLLAPGAVYLLDSGGQYRDGTTDITRTLTLGGRPTAEVRDRFTRVLAGHVAIARCRFPAGTSGQRIDALARTSLWQAGLDYGHGTGHGVGSFLSVHEGPIGIAPARALSVPLEEGHIVSNEPGYYLPGRFGIRVENLVLVVRAPEVSRAGSPFLRFETLSLCPIDRRMIDPALLGRDERAWVDDYHAEVLRRLGPHLEAEPRRWLEAQCRPLPRRLR